MSWSLSWTKLISSTGRDIGHACASDSNGNVYICGRTNGSLPDNTLTGGEDGFLVKYNSSGVVQWRQQFGTSLEMTLAIAIVIDSNDDIILGCYHNGEFGLRKFNSAGTQQYSKSWGSGTCEISNMVIDSSDNVYLCGYTNGNVAATANGQDIYIARYRGSDGARWWHKQINSNSTNIDVATNITINSAEDYIYICGRTMGAFSGESNAGSHDYFVGKYATSDGTGSILVQNGTTSADIATGIAIDSTDDYIYVTGYTAGTFSSIF